MDWTAILRAILIFIGPLLKDWLDSLLSRAADQLAKDTPIMKFSYNEDVEDALWDRAKTLLDDEASQLRWYREPWEFYFGMPKKKRVFNAARMRAKRRAGEFYEQAKTGNPVLKLSPVEIEAVNAA